MDVFCKRPYMMITTDNFGVYRPCCFATLNHPLSSGDDASVPGHSIKDMSMMEWYNTPEMVQLREDMQSGEVTPLMQDYCRRCIEYDAQGSYSGRKEKKNWDLPERCLELKLRVFGNKCNLKCYMCVAYDSSARMDQITRMSSIDPEIMEDFRFDNVAALSQEDLLADMDNHIPTEYARTEPEVFKDIIQDVVNNIDKIKTLSIIGGEPFIIDSHYELLDAVIATGQSKNIKLKYSSNLTKLQWSRYSIEEYFPHFEWVEIRWSMEAIGEKNNYIRYPSKWEECATNAVKVLAHPNVDVIPHTTRSALSILSLQETINWCKQFGFKRHKFNDVYRPEVCRVDYLPPSIRERLLEQYRGTEHEYFLTLQVDDWQDRWEKLKGYLNLLDEVNGTDYKQTFPLLTDDAF